MCLSILYWLQSRLSIGGESRERVCGCKSIHVLAKASGRSYERRMLVPNGAERFAIVLTAKAYVMDNRYESAFASDVHRRVKQSFRRHGIKTAGELPWR